MTLPWNRTATASARSATPRRSPSGGTDRPRLVIKANDELGDEEDLRRQVARAIPAAAARAGRPRPGSPSRAPLVMLLDAPHGPNPLGEAAARPTARAAPRRVPPAAEHAPTDDWRLPRHEPRAHPSAADAFAPPPEPPPPPRAGPARARRRRSGGGRTSAGAEEEGAESRTSSRASTRCKPTGDNRVEVVRLLGPRQATRTNVLTRADAALLRRPALRGPLRLRSPTRQRLGLDLLGSRATHGQRAEPDRPHPELRVLERLRVGHHGRRSRARNVELAPSFAEAFFDRGVSNFVCTAWPVNDVAAREFALLLYRSSSALPTGDGRAGAATSPRDAARPCRSAPAPSPRKAYGALTWGAYQHYGNPHFRFSSACASGTARSRPHRAGRKRATVGLLTEVRRSIHRSGHRRPASRASSLSTARPLAPFRGPAPSASFRSSTVDRSPLLSRRPGPPGRDACQGA